MMAFAQVVETSVNTNNSPSQVYTTNPDDHSNHNIEINVNLLLNTCNFHRKFRLIFSLILSENAPNVDFREAKFQNFPGEHAPGPL